MDQMGYRIIRSSRRKRIAFRIADDGVLEVLSPVGVPERHLCKLIHDGGAVIDELRRRFRRAARPVVRYTEGELFWLLGHQYPLRFSSRLRLFDGENFIVPGGETDAVQKKLMELYRELAAEVFSNRLAELCRIAGVRPERLRISSASGRWGSRSSSGTLSLSWKLIQCPLRLVDYVIFHELAHIREMNHSPAFWSVVAAFCPDYRQRRAELIRFARQLPRFD